MWLRTKSSGSATLPLTISESLERKYNCLTWRRINAGNKVFLFVLRIRFSYFPHSISIHGQSHKTPKKEKIFVWILFSSMHRQIYSRPIIISSLLEATIDIRMVSRPPPTPSPYAQTLSHLNWMSALPSYRKEELRGRGSNSISNFHHHNINSGAVDNTWRHR
jgi:hypothetical protein